MSGLNLNLKLVNRMSVQKHMSSEQLAVSEAENVKVKRNVGSR